jgi:hypothetical protein
MKPVTRKSPTKVADLNIRSIIDEIALEVTEAIVGEDDLSTAISDKTMEHITRLREEHALSEEELDRIARAITSRCPNTTELNCRKWRADRDRLIKPEG